MSTNEKPLSPSRLKQRLERNFRKAVEISTKKNLGDRSKYIGASDVSSCLRKAYLSKKQKVDYSIDQLLTFQRGHAFEKEIVEKFLFGETYKKQVEINSKASNGFAISAHLDFVMYDKEAKTATVIEAKSTRGDIEFYDSYHIQVQLQMGLLQKQCGSDWKIDGAIAVVSSKDSWELLEVKQNQALYDIACAKTNALAEALEKDICPDGEEQLFCSTCPFKDGCPALQKVANLQKLPNDVVDVVKNLKSLKKLEEQISLQKKQLKDFFEATGIKQAKAAELLVSMVEVEGKKEVVDVAALRATLPDIFMRYKTREKYSFIKIT